MSKKILYTLIAGCALLLVSCAKEQPGGTNAQAMAGQWYVQVDGAYEDPDEPLAEDIFEMGRFMILTYNTASDTGDEFIVDDLGNFWEFKVKVPCNRKDLSFSCEAAANMVEGYEELEVTITDGRIVPGGAVTPSGAKADYIEFYVVFSDDSSVPADYDKLKFSGWRYTGLANDD